MSVMIVLGLLIGIGLFWYIPDCLRDSVKEGEVRVSIIIPARNEAENLRRLLPSLMGEGAEIIVADDQSEDGTAEVAKFYGAKVVQLPPPPEGWLGKAWGCWNGSMKATGEVLLFLDADTVLEAGGVKRLCSRFRREGTTLLSVHPFHMMRKPYEYASAFFHLIVFASMNAFHVFSAYMRPAGAFGQCLLCGRTDYFRYGGHAVHPDALLETFMLADHVVRQGGTVAHVSGKGAVAMQMYPEGMSSLIEGWSKNFAKGAISVPLVLLAAIALWMNALVIWLQQLASPTVWTAAFYAAFVLHTYLVIRRIGSFGLGSALLFPVHLLIFFGIFCMSVYKALFLRRVTWKGRTIPIRRKG